MRKPAGLQQFWGQRFRLRLLDLRFDSASKFRCSALCIAPRCNKIGALPQLLFLGGCTKLETLAFQARILDHSTLTARHCSYCKCNSRAQEEVGGDSNPICAEPNYRPGSATPCILPCWNTALHYEACESFFFRAELAMARHACGASGSVAAGLGWLRSSRSTASGSGWSFCLVQRLRPTPVHRFCRRASKSTFAAELTLIAFGIPVPNSLTHLGARESCGVHRFCRAWSQRDTCFALKPQESRHLEAQYEAAEHQAAEAQAEALTAQKAARQARLVRHQHLSRV